MIEADEHRREGVQARPSYSPAGRRQATPFVPCSERPIPHTGPLWSGRSSAIPCTSQVRFRSVGLPVEPGGFLLRPARFCFPYPEHEAGRRGIAADVHGFERQAGQRRAGPREAPRVSVTRGKFPKMGREYAERIRWLRLGAFHATFAEAASIDNRAPRLGRSVYIARQPPARKYDWPQHRPPKTSTRILTGMESCETPAITSGWRSLRRILPPHLRAGRPRNSGLSLPIPREPHGGSLYRPACRCFPPNQSSPRHLSAATGPSRWQGLQSCARSSSHRLFFAR